jgi:diguanylate cyclase (GGDEF)-like protein
MLAPTQLDPNKSLNHRDVADLHAGNGVTDLAAQIFVNGLQGFFLAVGGLGLVAIIGVLDYATGPEFSFAIFYLLPIALAAWWGGFSQGILVALASAVSWQAVEILEESSIAPVIQVWNGTARFGIFVFTSSLLSRLRISLFLEKKLARSDPLTGVANGRTFYEGVSLSAEWSLRTSCPLTLVYLDLDNFKWLNDTLGHAKGDEALCALARIIQQHIRVTDVLARIGGDEFALLLSGCAGADALALLEAMQQEFNLEMARKKWPITISIGAMTFVRPLRDIDAMVRYADELMYEAKHAGKNQIVHRVMKGLDHGDEGDRSKIERRTTARVLCNRLARVRSAEETDFGDEFARVQDISANGLCLRLERSLPEQTLIAIEPLHVCGAKTLLVRVIWSVQGNGGWLHECVLPNRLSTEELQLWVAEQAAEVCADAVKA